MTTTSQPVARRRRFRFGLRTLLAAVTLAAVGSWAYWFGWPWWLAYRERIQFERTARQLKVGSTMDDVFAQFYPPHRMAGDGTQTKTYTENYFDIKHYKLAQAEYFIFL